MQEEITPQVEEVEQVCQGFQGYQVPIVCGGNDVPVVLLELSERDIKESFLILPEPVTIQVNLSMVPRVNVAGITMTSRLKDFVRINPHVFLVPKVGEELQ